MALASVGVDMVEIARMEKVLGRRPNFAKRVFTKEERAYCDRMARPAQHYAARFAAREAVLKALGTGFSRGIGFSDVSVGRSEAGQPLAVLTGKAADIAAEQGILEVALSLSYTHEVAVASAVAMTEEVRPRVEEKPDPKEELRASFRAARSVIDELERVEEQGQQSEEGQQDQQGQQGEEAPQGQQDQQEFVEQTDAGQDDAPSSESEGA